MENGRDAFYAVHIEGQTRTCFIIFKLQQGILTPENFAQRYEEKIHPYLDKKTGKRIYSKLETIITSAYGYSCWRRDPNINVRNQIDQLDTDTIYSKNMLEDVLYTNYTAPLDESKPQWRLVIVPKFDDGSGTIKSILFVAYHHCYFDGLCAAMLMNVFSRNAELIMDPVNVKVPLMINILGHLKTILYLPVLSLGGLSKRFGLTQMWIPNPVKILPRRKFYAFGKNPVSLGDVKKIKGWASSVENGASVSISNVLNTAIWRALKTTFPPERLVKELTFMEGIVT
ncbi:hypothetical protein Fcan01_04293 [Folsomia candida]|uniref:Diacylglycerol O-acyltransferase n=1 Tax=Folsomia candida TaxID=158441 RepID=A0A226EPK6_FOLCA|nr:hypothetical protein Fcan01_04293 [Folsomia candida]